MLKLQLEQQQPILRSADARVLSISVCIQGMRNASPTGLERQKEVEEGSGEVSTDDGREKEKSNN